VVSPQRSASIGLFILGASFEHMGDGFIRMLKENPVLIASVLRPVWLNADGVLDGSILPFFL